MKARLAARGRRAVHLRVRRVEDLRTASSWPRGRTEHAATDHAGRPRRFPKDLLHLIGGHLEAALSCSSPAGLALALFLTACHHKKRQQARPVTRTGDGDPRGHALRTGTDAPMKKKKPGHGPALLRPDRPARGRRRVQGQGRHRHRRLPTTRNTPSKPTREAISRYQSFLAFHPTHPQAAYCQFMIGEAWFEEIDTPRPGHGRRLQREGRPTRPWWRTTHQPLRGPRPRRRLAQVNDMLAAHEIRSGDWYLKNGHPKGAIARYRGVIEQIPQVLEHARGLLPARRGPLPGRPEQGGPPLFHAHHPGGARGPVLAKNAQQRIDRIQKKESAQGRPGEGRLQGTHRAQEGKAEAREEGIAQEREEGQEGEGRAAACCSQAPPPSAQPQDQQPASPQPPAQQPPPEQPQKQQAS